MLFLAGARRSSRRVEEVSRHPLELTLDLLAPDDTVDRVDGGQLSVPDRLGVILPEVVGQRRQKFVCDARQVRRRVGRLVG